MRTLIFALVAFLVLVPSYSRSRPPKIDPAFFPYVADFEKTMGQKVTGVDMKFNILEDPKIGVCMYKIGLNEIHIDPVNWHMMSDIGKEQLIYHELGHCVLNYSHDNSRVLVDGKEIEGTLMNSMWFGERPHYRKYLLEYKLAFKNHTLIAPKIKEPIALRIVNVLDEWKDNFVELIKLLIRAI